MRQALKRCATGQPGPTLTGLGSQPRRFVSYDKSALTKEALDQKLHAGLGDDEYGRALRIDADSKTISTAVGDLPISPVFDTQWMKARRRQRKDPPQPMGRFRTKLANNPFARALATPIREGVQTLNHQPRYFLQDFEPVKHPETGQSWIAPGPLAFALVNGPEPSTKVKGDETTATETKKDAHDTQTAQLRRRRSPITAYALCQKEYIDSLGESKKPSGGLFFGRHGMGMSDETMHAKFRPDMGDVLLKMMRRSAVDALITRSTREEKSKHLFVEPCQTWDAIKDVKLRGCVLWLPRSNDAPTKYATYDIEGTSYGKKMVVHNLHWLLGEEETARLMAASDIFRSNEIVVLKQWPRPGMMQLHLLLWKLQGYLPAEDAKPEATSDS